MTAESRNQEEETLSFQAEVSRLLDIVAHSLYSNREIFLRELISNAADACDKLRYLALQNGALAELAKDFEIRIRPEESRQCLVIEDNGVGMTRGELAENLGTIARSGTAAFVKELADASAGAPSLIGQFGVGFYSAFMVADEVTVESRRAGEAEGWRWRSDGKGAFALASSAEAPAAGTRITLHMKKDAADFLEPARIRQIVKTYSDHIAVPIKLLGKDGKSEQLNEASALWTRPKQEIEEGQYREFYHHVAHALDEPWLRLHYRTEGISEHTALVYVPGQPPFDLFHPERRHGVKLYVKRVFITEDCEDLVPAYLRFLRGVVDTEDLPLNISREMLQHNPALERIRRQLTKRVLKEIEAAAGERAESYAEFWKNFGSVLKEGLYEDEGQRETLLKLARFSSSRGGGLISLSDYLEAMRPGQEAIYYISGQDAERLARSAQLEGFAAKGVEVLLLADAVDEFWIPAVEKYEGKPFRSVTRGAADLDKIEGPGRKEESKTQVPQAEVSALAAFLKLALKDEVKDVRLSARLTESPVCLVADEGDLDLNLTRLLRQHHQLDKEAKRILEINADHPLISAMARNLNTKGAGEALEELGRLLLDQARIMEGEQPLDAKAFAARLAAAVLRSLSGDADEKSATAKGDGEA